MPFVAIFTDRGKMVAFSDDRALVGMVSARMGDVLQPAEDPAEEDLRDARRKALRRFAAEIPDSGGDE